MVVKLKHKKVIGWPPPDALVKNTVYYAKVNGGIEIYVTNNNGTVIAEPLVKGTPYHFMEVSDNNGDWSLDYSSQGFTEIMAIHVQALTVAGLNSNDQVQASLEDNYTLNQCSGKTVKGEVAVPLLSFLGSIIGVGGGGLQAAPNTALFITIYAKK